MNAIGKIVIKSRDNILTSRSIFRIFIETCGVSSCEFYCYNGLILGIQQCDEGDMAIRIRTTVKSSTK